MVLEDWGNGDGVLCSAFWLEGGWAMCWFFLWGMVVVRGKGRGKGKGEFC